jgi:hypothetical protein
VSNDIKPTEKAIAGETPVFDFTKLMVSSDFQASLRGACDRERKNIEALASE